MSTSLEIQVDRVRHIVEEGDLVRTVADSDNSVCGEWDFVSRKDGELTYRDVALSKWLTEGFRFELSKAKKLLSSVAVQLRKAIESYKLTPHCWTLSDGRGLRRLQPGDTETTLTCAAPPTLWLTAMLLEDIARDMGSGLVRPVEVLVIVDFYESIDDFRIPEPVLQFRVSAMRLSPCRLLNPQVGMSRSGVRPAPIKSSR